MAAETETSVVSDSSGSVTEFYARRSVLVTGGTGFLGKALIEKLLYNCKDIANIFILIRDKKGICGEKRLQQMCDEPIFSRVIRDRPQDLKKLIPIKGDVNEINFGISVADQAILIEKVSVVFHVAATVKLREDFTGSVNTNVKGTISVMDFCHRINNLKAFVYISTAYCNPDQKILEEKVYPLKTDFGKVFEYTNQPTQDSNIENELLNGFPNTYTLTKNLTESYISIYCGNLPTVIIRPSIVAPALRDPLLGWTGNWRGATGLTITSINGSNKVLYGDGNNILDLIPVDYVTNVTIVAPTKCSRSDSLIVYNCCTSSCNPISTEKFIEGVRRTAMRTGFGYSKKAVIFTKSKFLMLFITFFLQTVPAYIADLYRWATGKKPMYVQLQSRVIEGRTLLTFYTSHSWEMKADNIKAMHSSLSYSDKNIFPCDPSLINWDEYYSIFLHGVKTHLMKDV